jgi:hypothetical protein
LLRSYYLPADIENQEKAKSKRGLKGNQLDENSSETESMHFKIVSNREGRKRNRHD